MRSTQALIRQRRRGPKAPSPAELIPYGEVGRAKQGRKNMSDHQGLEAGNPGVSWRGDARLTEGKPHIRLIWVEPRREG